MGKMKTETIEWVSVDDGLPEYSNRAGRESFVMVLVDHEKTGVNETMYCDGIFYEPLLISYPEIMEAMGDDGKLKFHKGVKYWAYKPNGAIQLSSYEMIKQTY